MGKWFMWSDSEPEVKFQYGGSLFLETGSSNNAAVDWDTSNECRH